MADKFLKKIFLAFSFLLIGHNCLKAQYYISGNNPASIRWMQMKGDNYKLIYPKGLDSMAREYLWLLEKNRLAINLGLQVAPKPIQVTLNPYTVKSNGMVTWTPKRVELFPQTRNGGYPQVWQEQLVIHEGRHVGQLTQFTKHIYKPLYFFIGEHGSGLGIALHGARWLFEGDAVIAETALSNSGRGRTASFMDYYRVAFLEGDFRTWDRMRYGSFKEFAPNEYAFGYLILSTQRFKTPDANMSGKVLDYVSKIFYNPNNLNVAFAKYGEEEYKDSYNFASRTMQKLWKDEHEKRGTFTNSIKLLKNTDNSGYYNSYDMGVVDDNLNYFCSNLSYLDIYKLKKIDSLGNEFSIRPIPGSININDIDEKNLIFTQTTQDKRWENRTYSNIYKYNLDTKKIKRVTKKGSYFFPSVQKTHSSNITSNYNKKVATIENLITGENRISILNLENGNLISTINPIKGTQIANIAWGENYLYALMTGENGSGLYKMLLNDSILNSQNFSWIEIIKPQYSYIKNLRCNKDSLYFICDADGVDNIFLITNNNQDNNVNFIDVNNSYKLQRLTNSKYGVQSPFIKNNTLYYNELELSGHKPARISLDSVHLYNNSFYNVSLSKDGKLSSKYKYVVAEELARQDKENLQENNIKLYTLKDTLTEKIKPIKPGRYSQIGHLIRIHSWMPFYFNADKVMSFNFDKVSDVIKPGATIYSQNTLGTAITMLGYSYWKGHHAGHFNFTYSGLYPIFELAADINDGDRIALTPAPPDSLQFEQPAGTLVKTSVSTYIPFNLSSNGWHRILTPQLKWEFNNNVFYHYDAKNKEHDSFSYSNLLKYSIRYYQGLSTPVAANYPKFGIGIVLSGVNAINGRNNFGKTAGGYIYSYIPGFKSRQGIRVTAGYQKQFANNKQYYIQNNLIPQPRGFNKIIYAEDYASFSIDYAIPIYIGDVSLSWFAYLQQLNIIPFYDFAISRRQYGSNTYHTFNYGSIGTEVSVNAIFFHMSPPVKIGIRYAYNHSNNNYIKYNSHHCSLVFSVSMP